MSNIDKQRVAAVRTLHELGWQWSGTSWTPPASETGDFRLLPVADAMHRVLADRAEALAGCTEDEEEELGNVADALDAYEAIRWPGGKVAGGKG